MNHDDELIEQIKADYTQAPLDARRRAMLDYAHKLTLRPSEMEREDVDRLREVGFSNSAILDLNLVTAYFAFVNRIADGLGVELEGRWGRE